MSNEKVKIAHFYLCSCFNTDNIYLEDYNLHVRFVTEQQFRLDYQEVSVRGAQFINDLFFRHKWALNSFILPPIAVEEARLCDRTSV